MFIGLMAIMFMFANKGIAETTVEKLQKEKWNTLGALELERKFKISEPPPKTAEEIADINEEYTSKKIQVSEEYNKKMLELTWKPHYVLSGDTIDAVHLDCEWVDVEGTTVTVTMTGNIVDGKLASSDRNHDYWDNKKCVSDMSCTIGLKSEYNTKFLNPILSKIMWGDANAKYGQKVSILVEEVECSDYICNNSDSFSSNAERANYCFADWMHRGQGAKVQEMTHQKSKKSKTSNTGGTNAQ